METKIDVEFFLLIVAREITYCESLKNALNGYYKGQKIRFYERAKKSKYYNHFIITEGSLEYEMEIKRIFGILLCADEEKDIRDYVMKMMVSYKSEMKFLLSQELDKEKLVLYYLKKQKQFLDDGHKVPGSDVEFWLHNYLLYYNHTDNNMTGEVLKEFYKSIKNCIGSEQKEKYKEERTRINDTNWKKQLSISEYVLRAMEKLDDEEVLYTLGDILGLQSQEQWNDEANNIFDIFVAESKNGERESRFLDIVKSSAFCLLLDNMLKAEGINFFNIYTERVISKKDKEYLLKAIAKSWSGTLASALNVKEIELEKTENETFTIKRLYNLTYSDIVLAFLFKGLIRAIKDDKKYAVSNYPENLFTDATVSKMSSAESANYEKQVNALKCENEKLKNEISILKHTIAQKDKILDIAVREEEDKHKDIIKEKDELIKVFQEQLISFAELNYLLAIGLDVDETEEVLPYDLEELQQKKMLIVGGRIEKIQELRKLLPKSVFISNENDKVPDTKFDLIFFFNNFLNHSLFFKYIKKAREEDTNVSYCIHTNIEKALSDMYEGLKGSKTLLFEKEIEKERRKE